MKNMRSGLYHDEYGRCLYVGQPYYPHTGIIMCEDDDWDFEDSWKLVYIIEYLNGGIEILSEFRDDYFKRFTGAID